MRGGGGKEEDSQQLPTEPSTSLSESLSGAHCLPLFLNQRLLISYMKQAFQLVEGNLMAQGKD